MKTKLLLFSLCCLGIFTPLNAQVGMGTTNPQSTLDIEASNATNPSNADGILIPRVNNFPASNPTAAQDGMLVFYTGTIRSGKGFYYWDQSINDWIFLSGAKQINDLLDGKTENGSLFLGDNVANSATASAFSNVGVGEIAFRHLTDGDFNIAIGPGASENLRTGNDNISIGLSSMSRNRNGNDNIAIGNYTGLNSDIASSGNIFIGNWAGFNEYSGGNKLYIENSSANAYQALIYGEFDNDFLRVNGRLAVNNELQVGNYTLPTSDGNYGEVLTTDGTGQISFVDPSSLIAGGNTLDQAYDEGGAGAGRSITADNGAVNIQGTDGMRVEGNIVAGSSIIHDGDNDTFLSFTPDRIEIDTGGINYVDIDQTNQEITFNEGSEAINFRVESDTNQNLLFVDGTNNRVGIGTNTPNNSLHIDMNTPFDVNHNNIGQDDIFLTGDGANALNQVAASIGFGGTNNRRNLRRAAIASLQSGGDVDFTGLAFYVHGNAQTESPMVERMRLNHQGFLGINNIDPSATLDVVGSMQFVDGNETAGYVLSSDADGNAEWTDPNTLVSTSDDDWTVVGTDIERQSGDVYIGDTSGTDNDLYISNRIIDWDDNSYLIDPDNESVVNKINFDAGSSAEPSITFDNDTSTGFYRNGVNGIGFTSNGTSFIRFSPRGQIEFFNTGNSIYLGQSAGNSDDFTDNRNIGIGRAVLTNNTTGDFNVGVGYLTLQSNTSGQRNVALGHGVMPFNTTGGNNIAFGSGALNYNLDGNSNISLGTNSLRDNISGNSNIGIGSGALLNNEASNNIGIGTSAGTQLTTGTANIGIGRSAQGSNQEGNDNIAIGSQSMLYTNHATNANSNVALGTLAMATVDEGSNNIAIGNAALFGSYDAANNNVAIGHQAGQGVEGNNNIYIGYQAGYNDGASSNHLYIESSNADETAALIYGEFDNDILRFNGNVGIGRAPSTNALEVEGEASKTTAGAFVANSDCRLKTNIETISGKTALQKLLSLRGVSYEWNDNQTKTKRPEGIQYGFIAQELMEVFPEKVSIDNLGFYQTAYGDYDAFFVQAIKELKNELDLLKVENATLKAKLDKLELLEARLSALENNTETSQKSSLVSKE